VHKFSTEERRRVIETVNDPRFADLTPAQIVAILAEVSGDNEVGRRIASL
jgi:hypothetical protein